MITRPLNEADPRLDNRRRDELEGILICPIAQSRALVEHRVLAWRINCFQVVGTNHGDEARNDFLNGIREILNAGEPTTLIADINTGTDIRN